MVLYFSLCVYIVNTTVYLCGPLIITTSSKLRFNIYTYFYFSHTYLFFFLQRNIILVYSIERQYYRLLNLTVLYVSCQKRLINTQYAVQSILVWSGDRLQVSFLLTTVE